MDLPYPEIVSHINYWAYIVLMMIGLYTILSKSNLVKKVIGLNILQTAIILFFISIGSKKSASIPIVMAERQHPIDAAAYINPLPHVLMLTAIVVAVATLGVALALAIRVFREYGTLEEKRILAGGEADLDPNPGEGQ